MNQLTFSMRIIGQISTTTFRKRSFIERKSDELTYLLDENYVLNIDN